MNSQVFKTSSSTLIPPEQNGSVPDWIQLFPSGSFSGRDGRGPFVCDAASVVAQTRNRNGSLDIPIDYDHQIEFSSSNGQPAPAAGWITELEARDTGVWGRVEWTDKGKAHVVAREYRYVSPVYYHEQDGTILSIESVALTNVPNLNMKALASREFSDQNPFTGDSTMSFLKTIASVLGMTDAEPTEASVEAAARQLVQESRDTKAVMSTVAQAVKSSDATPDGLVKAVQSVAMRAEKPDAAQYVPIKALQEANAELLRLKSAQAVSLVEQGKSDGKISPALEEWAKNMASSNPEALRAFLASAPDLRPGGGQPVDAGATPPSGGDALGGTAKTLCRAMGITEDSFIKAMHSVKGGIDDSSDE